MRAAVGPWLAANARVVFLAALCGWLVEGVLFLLGPIGPLVSDMGSYWATGTADMRTHLLGTYWPPLYPLLTVPFHRAGGPGALAAVQTVVAVAMVVGVGWYLLRTQGMRAAALFMAAMAAFPLPLLYARFVLTDDWLMLLLLAWVVLAEGAERTGRTILFLAGGICLGVGAGVRPEFVAVGALATLWLALRGRWWPAAWTLAPIAAEALGFAAYSWITTGVLVGSQQGLWGSLWEGNNPKALGFYSGVGPANAVPAVYRHLFLQWFSAHPLHYVLLCLARAVEFWFSSPGYIQPLAVRTHLVPLAWLVLAWPDTVVTTAVFFVALLRLYRQGGPRQITWALIAVGANWLFSVPFLVAGRFREDVLPLMLVVSAVAFGTSARAASPAEPMGLPSGGRGTSPHSPTAG